MVGAVSGLTMVTDVNSSHLVLVISLLAALLLLLERPYWISGLMMVLVALMGLSFIMLAFTSQYSFTSVLKASIEPSVPTNSILLILGLIGTTIVPYNIFLGSAISSQQRVPLMRTGLIVSVFLGGVITAFVLVAGTVVVDFTSFDELIASFKNETGTSGVFALSAGLFGAGFSSAVTAPYAASIIASTVFGWSKWKVVSVWLGVIVVGAVFGMSDFKPVRLIVVVQALNGIILPLLILLLIIIINDKKIISQKYQAGIISNVLLVSTFIVVTAFSGYQLYAALT